MKRLLSHIAKILWFALGALILIEVIGTITYVFSAGGAGKDRLPTVFWQIAPASLNALLVFLSWLFWKKGMWKSFQATYAALICLLSLFIAALMFFEETNFWIAASGPVLFAGGGAAVGFVLAKLLSEEKRHDLVQL